MIIKTLKLEVIKDKTSVIFLMTPIIDKLVQIHGGNRKAKRVGKKSRFF